MGNFEFADIKFWITAILSTLGGMTIAWIDSQPGWDDTGITVGMLYILSALAGFFNPKKLWLWALLCGLWIPVVGILRSGDILMLLVILTTFAGAYSGGTIRKIISQKK